MSDLRDRSSKRHSSICFACCQLRRYTTHTRIAFFYYVSQYVLCIVTEQLHYDRDASCLFIAPIVVQAIDFNVFLFSFMRSASFTQNKQLCAGHAVFSSYTYIPCTLFLADFESLIVMYHRFRARSETFSMRILLEYLTTANIESHSGGSKNRHRLSTAHA